MLGILPLMYMLYAHDIVFLVKALQQPSSQFNIMQQHIFQLIIQAPGHHLLN